MPITVIAKLKTKAGSEKQFEEAARLDGYPEPPARGHMQPIEHLAEVALGLAALNDNSLTLGSPEKPDPQLVEARV